MAGIITALSDALSASPDHLTAAVKGVFSNVPESVGWCPHPVAAGCWVTESGPDIYALNLTAGVAICNGYAPSHLPRGIVDDPVYRSVFQSAVFDVTPRWMGDTSHMKQCTALMTVFTSGA